MYNYAKIFKLLGLSLAILGISYFSPQLVSAQKHLPTKSIHGIGNIPNYNSGTRIDKNGTIYIYNGGVILPTSTVNEGNGITTYYYPDGTHLSIQNHTISQSGNLIAPGALNGGIPTFPNQQFPGNPFPNDNNRYIPTPGINQQSPINNFPNNNRYIPTPGINKVK